MDGLGECIKNTVYRAVMPGKEIIKTPKEFTESAQRLVKTFLLKRLWKNLSVSKKHLLRQTGTY